MGTYTTIKFDSPKIGLIQLRDYIWVLLLPPIPYLHPLFQDLNVLRICHADLRVWNGTGRLYYNFVLQTMLRKWDVGVKRII